MRTSPRPTRLKLLLLPAALVLAAGSLAGCGDDSSDSSSSGGSSDSGGSATSATGPDSEFCTVLGSGGDISDGKDVALFVKKLKSTGAPEDIPADARKGYDVYLGVLDDVDPDASAKDLQNMQQTKLSKEKQTEVQSFLSYASSTCAPAPSGGAETPSDGGQ